MSLMTQDDVGRCDFIDVLEEASLRGRPVGIQLRSGESFIDRITDVVTEGGVDWAVFERHERVPVLQVRACTRSAP